MTPALIQRVESARGPDREIDAAIAIIKRLDGDRDYSNRSELTVEMTLKIAALLEALKGETELADRALDDACGLAISGRSMSLHFPAKENMRRLEGFLPYARTVWEWTYPIRRARAAARNPNHPDNERKT